MRPPFFRSPIARISVRSDDEPFEHPIPIVRGPKGRSGRQHSEAHVEAVRRLIEESTLNYLQIEKRTGIARNNISRWKIDRGWKRPPFAPRAWDTVPTARASAQLKRRMLGQRLHALAERHIRELEESACVDPDKLAEALELWKMTKLAAGSRQRWDAGPSKGERMRPIMELCAADVALRYAPRDAVEDFLAHRAPPAVKPPRRRHGRRPTRNEHHAWLLGRDSGR